MITSEIVSIFTRSTRSMTSGISYISIMFMEQLRIILIILKENQFLNIIENIYFIILKCDSNLCIIFLQFSNFMYCNQNARILITNYQKYRY